MTALRPEAPAPRAPAPPLAHARPIDEARAASAVAELLAALGLDASSDALAGTPRRVARWYAELLTPRPFQPTTFPNDAGYDELVLVRDIRFVSLCERHLLPFRGVAHVGSLPAERIVGLSKLARIVEAFAARPQRQERLTAQVAGWLRDHLAPSGAGVVIEAEHLCATLPGAHGEGASTVTSALHGRLRGEAAARQEFLDLARGRH